MNENVRPSPEMVQAYAKLPGLHRAVFEMTKDGKTPEEIMRKFPRQIISAKAVENILARVEAHLSVALKAAQPGGLQPEMRGDKILAGRPDLAPSLNPPKPSDFGIPPSIVSDLKRIDGAWFKSFDSAWAACKPYYESWKKFKNASEQYQAFLIAGQHQFWVSMSPRSFESYAAGLLQKLGYSVSLSGGSNDRGVDIYANDGKGLTVIQCKAYNKLVGPAVVRELAGAMAGAHANRGWLFTLRGGSQGALQAIRDFNHNGVEVDLFSAHDYAKASMIAFYREQPELMKPEIHSRIPQAS